MQVSLCPVELCVACLTPHAVTQSIRSRRTICCDRVFWDWALRCSPSQPPLSKGSAPGPWRLRRAFACGGPCSIPPAACSFLFDIDRSEARFGMPSVGNTRYGAEVASAQKRDKGGRTAPNERVVRSTSPPLPNSRMHVHTWFAGWDHCVCIVAALK